MWQPQWSLVVILVQATRVCQGQNTEAMDTMQLLSAFGAPGESHEVFTQDGYILTIHRMQPRGPGTKPPVLLQHGMLGASNCWVLMGPEKDLAFLLWKKGYDVWLSNVRGTTYGKRHVNKTVQDRSFWQFSIHEMGYYDMPAIIDYILKLTRQSNLYYVGHSMGTTIFYIMGATRPEYNKKIRCMFSLSPVAYMSNVANWLKLISKNRQYLYKSATKHGLYEAFPGMKVMRLLAADLCRDGSPVQTLCLNIIWFSCGYEKQFNKTIMPVVFSHIDTTSANTLMHYSQHIESGDFQRYDYGNNNNLKLYGSKRPPSYNPALITAPVVIYYSTNDPFTNEKDVSRLASKLPNLIGKFQVNNINHLGFLWATHAKRWLYDGIIKIMEKMIKK